MISQLLRTLCSVALAVQLSPARGEIVIDRTRIIYPAATPGVTVNLRNEADGPRLVQVWIDEGDPHILPQMSDVPFTVTPPILRLSAGKSQALRVAYHPVTGQPEANPQESVYWLNVLGIRPTDLTRNQVQFAFRTRIKLFLRPDVAPDQVDGVVQELQWALAGDRPVLRVRNPSALHVTLSSIVLSLQGTEYQHDDPPMLSPRTTTDIAFKDRVTPWQGRATLVFTTLDDRGSTRQHRVSVKRAED